MQTYRKPLLAGLLVVVVLACHLPAAFGQPLLPPPYTNNQPPPTNLVGSVPNYDGVGTVFTNGMEYLLVSTLPTTPDPTQTLPSWATIDPGSLSIDTNSGFIFETGTSNVATNAFGMDAGEAVGVVVGDTNSLFTITRGEFYVVLTNSSGELGNTRFEVKIMRNTTDFTSLFQQEMALAEYETNQTGFTLTPITNASTTNLYDLQVTFPLNVVAAPRVVSIRTEPLDTEFPWAQMQWLIGSLDSNSPPTYETDSTFTNLTELSTVPAMKLWAAPVCSVGLMALANATPNELNLFGVPGTVIQSSSSPASGFQDYLTPDEYGFGDADMSQATMWFYRLRVDSTP